MIETPIVARFDRLSALVERFVLRVTPIAPAEANLLVADHRDGDRPCRMVFSPSGPIAAEDAPAGCSVFGFQVSWGGAANPLLSALPETVIHDTSDDPELAALIRLLRIEGEDQRCGSDTVLDRLGEVLMVRLLRAQIERGATSAGVLGGLADPRLSRAIVAVHEAPGRHWRSEDLAEVAGLSLSRFAELFTQTVGDTPMAYLRRWRMTLARQDLEKGERVQTVARRYGYGSSEALNRSFKKQYGTAPKNVRAGRANTGALQDET